MSSPHRRRTKGFTLIEVVVVMVVVSILAAVAVPAYLDQVRKGRRTEAREALMRIQSAQERWRSTNTTYAGTITALGMVASGSNYDYALTGANATGYTATATAKAKQAGDSACATITVTVAAGNAMTYGPTDACWAR